MNMKLLTTLFISSFSVLYVSAESLFASEQNNKSTTVVAPQFITAQKMAPSMLFRKEFTAKGNIRKATVKASAQGLYELRLNGRKVGDEFFTPGWTSYNYRIQCQEYDVTSQIKKGRNAIGIILGNGWFRSRMAKVRGKWTYGETIGAYALLTITYQNGEIQTIATDNSWKTTPSPITQTDIYDGERYDARLWQKGWDTAPFDDSRWQSAKFVAASTERLIRQEGNHVRCLKEINPIKKFTTPKGEQVYDFGQNMTGWVNFRLKGEQGDSIVLQFAETLDENGNFYTENLRTAKATDTYIFRGDNIEEHHPRFTFFGFRYVKVTGYRHSIPGGSLTAQVISSDIKPTGSFECSDSLVNKLVDNTRWSMTDNFLDIPTDCPQRDERLGWTADAQLFLPTASYLANVNAFYTKWMHDMILDQSPEGGVPCVIPNLRPSYGSSGWDDAITVIPMTLYKAYGNKELLEKAYPAMKKWVGYLKEKAGERLLYKGGRFGDWFAYTSSSGDYPGATTDKDLVGTAYFAYSTWLTAETADILGKRKEGTDYRQLFENIKKAFCKEFVSTNGRICSNTQTAYSLALAFNLLPDSLRSQAAARLADDVRQRGHITTGFLGTPLICKVLTQYGYIDEAYMLLLNKQYPSWLYPVTKGATTCWERWNGIEPDGTVGRHSFNHYAFGAVTEWLFSMVAGITQSESSVAYSDIVIAPHPGNGLSWVKCSFLSPKGMIKSEWTFADNKFTLDVEIPQGAKSTVVLPGRTVSSVCLSVSEKKGKTIIVGAGKHHFEMAY